MADNTEPSRLTINQKINKFENLNNSNYSKKRKLTNSTNLKLHVHCLSDKAKLPKLILKDHGYLLYSASNTVIPANGEGIVSTDIVIRLPEGTHGRVVGVGVGLGLVVKNFVGCGDDKVEFRGTVAVIFLNNSEVDFQVKEGDRIALLIIEKYCTSGVIEVKELKDLNDPE